MNALLTWARGQGLDLAAALFLFGLCLRLIEIYSLGRAKDLTEPRKAPRASGWHTILRRFLPVAGMLQKSPVSHIGGYLFHVGLAIVVVFFAPHILLIQGLIGWSWPGLPSRIIDLVSVLTLLALVVVLVDRIHNPVKRFLSTFEDWFTWTLTFLPVLTGWLTVQHLLLPYADMLALHILSAELLLAFLPYTRLFHAFTAWSSRWYNGEANAHRGIPV